VPATKKAAAAMRIKPLFTANRAADTMAIRARRDIHQGCARIIARLYPSAAVDQIHPFYGAHDIEPQAVTTN